MGEEKRPLTSSRSSKRSVTGQENKAVQESGEERGSGRLGRELGRAGEGRGSTGQCQPGAKDAQGNEEQGWFSCWSCTAACGVFFGLLQKKIKYSSNQRVQWKQS